MPSQERPVWMIYKCRKGGACMKCSIIVRRSSKHDALLSLYRATDALVSILELAEHTEQTIFIRWQLNALSIRKETLCIRNTLKTL